MSIDKSFYSLVKYNNGFFKSEKQAKFLLSQCEDGLYSIGGRVYNNSYLDVFECDDHGVVKVVRYNGSGIKIKDVFERDESVSMDDLAAKKEKFLDNKERILLINRLQDKWLEKKELMNPNNYLEQVSNMIGAGKKEEASALYNRIKKINESIESRISRICDIRDQLIMENRSR